MRTADAYLGEFEQLVLFAVLRLDEASGIAIHDEIEARTGRDVSPGAIYTTLGRLEERGLVSSEVLSPEPGKSAVPGSTTPCNRAARGRCETPMRVFRRWPADRSPSSRRSRKAVDMRPLRRLASFLVRGADADFIRHDLEEIYARDRAHGLPAWRAHLRYFRLLLRSALSVVHPGGYLTSSIEWLGEFRTGEALRDVRFGARLLRKHPVSAGIAIAGLGIAIGIVVSVFTIIDATMLRPFAMDDPASVVSVSPADRHWPMWPYSSFLRMREETTLARIEASTLEKVRIGTTSRDGGDITRFMLFVSGGYLEMLGGRPAQGRPLSAQDDSAGAPPVVMISHHLWSSALNADPAAIGQAIWINGIAVTLVGIMRPDFTGPIDADIRPAVWASLSAFDDLLGGKALDRDSRVSVEVVGRLKTGASSRAAEDNLSAIVKRLRPPSSPTILRRPSGSRASHRPSSATTPPTCIWPS